MFNNYDEASGLSRGLSGDINTNMDRRDHGRNVDRRILERDMMFNQNSTMQERDKLRNKMRKNKFSKRGSKMGEITGEVYEVSELEQGMPMRHCEKTQRFDNNKSPESAMYNPQLDFDLYDTDPSINVTYNDPSDKMYNSQDLQYSNISDLGKSENKIFKSDNVNPITTYSTCSNSFSLFVTSMLRSMLKKDPSQTNITLSPFGILNSLTIIYRGSKGRTEKEFNSHLYYKHRELMFDGASDIIKQISKCDNIKYFNVILVPETNYINKAFQKYANCLGLITNANSASPRRESQRINYLADKYTKGVFKNIVRTSDIKNNNGISVISLCNIKTEWTYPFIRSHTSPKLFHGNAGKRMVNMMHMFGKKLNYVEDSEHQLVELDLKNNNISMGFVICRNKRVPKLSDAHLREYLVNLNKEYLGVVQIPKFTHKSKYRINNVLETMGIKNIFKKTNLADITPDKESHISNVMHQCLITVNEGSDNLQGGNYNDFNPQSKQFIVDSSVLFYIRQKALNLILSTGIFM